MGNDIQCGMELKLYPYIKIEQRHIGLDTYMQDGKDEKKREKRLGTK